MSEAVITEPLVTEAETRVAVATQRQLIWWRFRKHKLAVVSAVIVGLFYLVASSPTCIAYAEPFDTEATRSYIPPQPIHWFDADGSFQPHVYRAEGQARPAHVQADLRAGSRASRATWCCSATAIPTTCSA